MARLDAIILVRIHSVAKHPSVAQLNGPSAHSQIDQLSRRYALVPRIQNLLNIQFADGVDRAMRGT